MKLDEKTYADKAEKVINSLDKKRNGEIKLTTSKIRNLLSMTMDIYNDVVNLSEEELSDELCGRIEYLRIRALYEAGREPAVKDFVEKAEIPTLLKHIEGSRKNYLLFTHYMEALVAFRKYAGGDRME